MNDFVFQSPTRFYFGRGYTDNIGSYLNQARYTKALLVYGGGSVVRTGTLDRVKQSLKAAGIDSVDLPGVRPNPEVGLVRTGIGLARERQVDVILAVGGGSVIDCSKAIAFGYGYGGDVWDFFCGKARPEEALPIAAVLTIPAAGSEASGSCVISNDELGQKRGANGDCFRPSIAVMDPELTLSLPSYQTAAGITDMICHVCERFFSGTGSSAVTDGIALSLVRAIIDAAHRLMDNPDDYDARADIMWAGTLAHNDIAGCGLSASPASRAGGWESHGIEHELSALDPAITHGAGLAVVMPAWMRYVWPENPQRFAQFARGVFNVEADDNDDAAREGVECLQQFFASLNMPSSLTELGITEDNIETLVNNLAQTKGEEFGSFKKLGRKDTRAIFESAL
jgi:alcohol dehydrogenase YqhD (iron-dependent ADH family)